MKYESESSDQEDLIGFAVEGDWHPNKVAHRLMSSLERWNDATQRWSESDRLIAVYSRRWRRKAVREKSTCTYLDLFLLGSGVDAVQDNRRQDQPSILLGVHKHCEYSVDDFTRSAKALGFRERDYLTKEQLKQLVLDAILPYVAPCRFAREIFRSAGYRVSQW